MYGARVQVVEGAEGAGALRALSGATHRGFVADGQRLRIRSSAVGEGGSLALVSTLRGAAVLGQGGHSWRAEPGTLVLLDAERASWLASDGSFSQVGLFVSARALVGERTAVLGSWTAESSAVSRLLVDGMRALGEARTSPEVDAISGALVGLLREATLSFSAREGSAQPSARVRRALRQIESQFPDPSLTPERIASEQGVSRRWLDAAFRANGSTVATAILERRLDAARDLLTSHPELQVAEVALRCGFPSLSALSHAFRKRFGASPSHLHRRTPST